MNGLATIPIYTGTGIGLTMPVVGTIGVDVLVLLDEEGGYEVDYIVDDRVATQLCNQRIGVDTGLGHRFATEVEGFVVADKEFLVLLVGRTHLYAQLNYAVAEEVAHQVRLIHTCGVNALTVVEERQFIGANQGIYNRIFAQNLLNLESVHRVRIVLRHVGIERYGIVTGLLVVTVENPDTVIRAERPPVFLRALGHQIEGEAIGAVATIGGTIVLLYHGVTPEGDGLTIVVPFVRQTVGADSNDGVVMNGAMEGDIDFVDRVTAVDGCQAVEVPTLVRQHLIVP